MNENDAEIAALKRELRKRSLAFRRALSAEERASYSAAITERLLSLEAVNQARTIFAYAAMEDEVQTEALISSLLQMGKRVAIPLVTGKRTMEAVLAPSMDALEYGAYHILTVREDRRVVLPPQEIDCVLVPGVAFDMDGTRLGMGGGYYDVFLPKIPCAVKIALAYSCQIVESIPKLSHDCGVDWIVTEKGSFRAGKNK